MSVAATTTADNELEWRALGTMVGLSSGFTLGFVVSDHPELLAETRWRLRAALGEGAVAQVALGPQDADVNLLDTLREAAHPQAVRIVTVSGADGLLDPHGEHPARALERLNFNRTSLTAACPKPLVVLLAPWALSELIRAAPDLWSVRSGMYRLGASTIELAQLVAALPTDGAADRRERGITRRVLAHVVEELAGDEAQLELAALLRLGRTESLLGDYEDAAQRYDRALQIALLRARRLLAGDQALRARPGHRHHPRRSPRPSHQPPRAGTRGLGGWCTRGRPAAPRARG